METREEVKEFNRVAQRRTALEAIVAALCRHGFMNGWLGDTSEDYQREQVERLLSLTVSERRAWLDRNQPNLEMYCGTSINSAAF